LYTIVDNVKLFGYAGESLGLSFLSPYLESSGSDFYHGANFAFTGSTIDGVYSAFTLPRQISQFRHFQNRTRLLRARGLLQSLFIS